MNNLPFGELGIAGLGLIIALYALDMVRKRYRQTENGDRRKAPVVMNCPNRVPGLAETLVRISSNIETSTHLLAELLRIEKDNQKGIQEIRTVSSLHGAGSRSERVREESRDLLRDLLSAVQQRE